MASSKRILVLVHPFFHPKHGRNRAATEFDVWRTLRRLGHEVEIAAAENDLRRFDRQLADFQPDLVFNLLEEFRGEGIFDFHLVSYLEALGIPYTGCNPRGLAISRNKYWATQVAVGAGLAAPRSAVGSRALAPAYPAVVKLNREHASMGMSQASVVRDLRQLRKCRSRMEVAFDGELIVQEFIPGREVSVAVVGNDRLQALAPWSLRLPSPKHIATPRVKFNAKYRQRLSIRSGRLTDLALVQALQKAARRAFSVLDLNGYARFDYRISSSGKPFLIDVNANPCLSKDEDFARAASGVGISYPELIERIIKLGITYQPRR